MANLVSAAAAKKEIFKYVVGGVDFGLTNLTVFLVVGQKADGSLWILDEIYRKQMTPEILVKSAKVLQQRWNVSRFYCDLQVWT